METTIIVDQQRGKQSGVLDGIKEYMQATPAYQAKFFQVAEAKEPVFPIEDIYSLLPFNQKEVYDFDEVLARLAPPAVPSRYR